MRRESLNPLYSEEGREGEMMEKGNQIGFVPFLSLFFTKGIRRLEGRGRTPSGHARSIFASGYSQRGSPGHSALGSDLCDCSCPTCLLVWTLTSVGRTQPVKPVSVLGSCFFPLGQGLA